MNDFAPSVTPPGVNHNLDPDDSPLDYFYLFLEKSFFEELVVQTNSYAEQERTRAAARGHPHKTLWTPTTLPEMKAWIGINISYGLKGRSAIDDIWSNRTYVGDSDLSRIMSRNRYWALSRYFHISDNNQTVLNQHDPNYDPLYKVRAMINLVNANSARVYKPKQNICVDEAMVKCKSRHHAKQYMPQKSIKWGDQSWDLC